MKHNLPIVSEELQDYLTILLDPDSKKNYLRKVITPMEDYTLHVYDDLSQIGGTLDHLETCGYKAQQHSVFPNIIVIEPKGPFELDLSDIQKQIVVDNRAAEMIYQGSDIFVPGVKRADKVKRNDEIVVASQQGINVAKAISSMNHSDMLKTKKGIAAKNVLSPFQVPSIEQLDMHHLPIYFQSFPAYLTSVNLDPKPNDSILDCCAAPGNKTIHLSELTKDQAKIVAVDRSKRRLQKLIDKIQRFKIKNISTFAGDIIELSKNWSQKFNKILVDPPCTALGLRPRLFFGLKLTDIHSSAIYQKAILFACKKLLKQDGELLYSTCTITKEENEEVIDYAIQKLNFEIIEQKFRFSKSETSKEFEFPFQRFIPGKDRTIGYFIAKLRNRK